MQTRTVDRTLRIEAPIERVWDALIDPDRLAEWLLPPALGARLRRDGGGALVVCMGPVEARLARLEAIEAPRRVRMRLLPDERSDVAFELEEEDGGTRVTVTASASDGPAAAAAGDRLALAGAAWEKGLANLQAHVMGREVPFPEATWRPFSGSGSRPTAVWACSAASGSMHPRSAYGGP